MQLAQVIIDSLTLFVLGIGLLYSAKQISSLKKTHQEALDWNRRIEAKKALQTASEKIASTIKLYEALPMRDSQETIPRAEIERVIEERPDLHVLLSDMLNWYESLASGILQRVYDEEVIKIARRGDMIRCFDRYKNYIHFIRGTAPRIWEDMEHMAEKWRAEIPERPYRPGPGE
jgi:hypothetical protein